MFVEGDLRTFSFSVQQRPNGTVAGQSQIFNRSSGFRIHMVCDCYTYFDDNTVVVSGIITSSNNPDWVGQTGIFAARDNGQGASAPPDQISQLAITGEEFVPGTGVPLPPGIDCSNILDLFDAFNIDPESVLVDIAMGNVKVW